MTVQDRSLSPHLLIYRPQITSVLSISHRITGVGLLLGLVVLAWWIVAAAMGPEAFACVQAFLGSWFGQFLLFGWTMAFFYHLLNGLRHLAWDMGWGINLPAVYRSGVAVLVGTLVLTLASWCLAYSISI